MLRLILMLPTRLSDSIMRRFIGLTPKNMGAPSSVSVEAPATRRHAAAA
jgi:hypothetical protein